MAREEPYLFEIPAQVMPEPLVHRPAFPLWTENKAKLIERYLYYFVLVTKHGTYLDGFAGPQRPGESGMWAAQLVLESEPRWFRHFHLFDVKPEQVEYLSTLKDAHAERDVRVYQGDFNVRVREVLASGSIKQREATFCLLDQRTFECHWSTLEALARYKTSGHKMELFYFLPHFWLGRALSAQKNTQVLADWWGREDWEAWRTMPPYARVECFVERVKRELGYWSVKPCPIYERQDSGNIMYYMIHATDHPAAPSLMSRAYDRAVKPKEPYEQLRLEFEALTSQS